MRATMYPYFHGMRCYRGAGSLGEPLELAAYKSWLCHLPTDGGIGLSPAEGQLNEVLETEAACRLNDGMGSGREIHLSNFIAVKLPLEFASMKWPLVSE